MKARISLLAASVGVLAAALAMPLAAQQGRGAGAPAPTAPGGSSQRGGGAPADAQIANAIAGRGGSDAPGMAPLAAADAPADVKAAPPLHIYIRVGLKSHGPGQHDYPQLIADWSKILTERGAVVDGSFHFPTIQELSGVNVLVMYKGDQAYMEPQDRVTVEQFVKRGGGIVTFHDTLCGDDPAYFATLVGGAKHHGDTNFTLEADLPYQIMDPASPITKDMKDFTINDEAFYSMTWANNDMSSVHSLINVKIPSTPSSERGGGVGQVIPQAWTYEHTIFGGQPARAFVWMQGHTYANFTDPRIEPMLLRGIAWAAHWPVDTLLYAPQPSGRGGRGGGGGRGAGAPGAAGAPGGAAPAAGQGGAGRGQGQGQGGRTGAPGAGRQGGN